MRKENPKRKDNEKLIKLEIVAGALKSKRYHFGKTVAYT